MLIIAGIVVCGLGGFLFLVALMFYWLSGPWDWGPGKWWKWWS